MKVKLNLKNRILAFSLIANTKEASLTDWRVINDAKQKLGISEKDRELYKIEEVEGDKSKGIQWKNIEEAAKEKEYDLPKRVVELIENDLKRKDKQGNLTEDLIPLAEQFIGGE